MIMDEDFQFIVYIQIFPSSSQYRGERLRFSYPCLSLFFLPFSLVPSSIPSDDGRGCYPGGTNSLDPRNICGSFYEGKMDSRHLHEISPIDSVVDEGYDPRNTLLPVVPLGFPGLPLSYQHEMRKQMLSNNYPLDMYAPTEVSPSSAYDYRPQDTSSRDRCGARGRKPQQGIPEEKESLHPQQGMPGIIHFNPNQSGSSSAAAGGGGGDALPAADSAGVEGVLKRDSQPVTRSPQAKAQKKTRRVRRSYAFLLVG